MLRVEHYMSWIQSAFSNRSVSLAGVIQINLYDVGLQNNNNRIAVRKVAIVDPATVEIVFGSKSVEGPRKDFSQHKRLSM